MKIAYMFSGQGSQVPKMGLELYENFEVVKNTYDKYDNVLDFKITDMCFNENELLNNTMYTQPSLLLTSIAISKLLDGVCTPDYVLGLSLGEYSAITYANAMDIETALNLVYKRGQFMNDCVKDLKETGMYAVLSLDEEKIKEIIEKTKQYGTVEISNYNTKGQIVIAGYEEALLKCVELIKEAKGKAIKLNVSGPFHTSLLENASVNLNKELNKITFNDFDYKVVTNLTASVIEDKSELVDILTNQVKSSVKWQQSIEFLLNDGVDTFIEIGPSKTLSNFVKKIDRKVTVLNIEDKASLEKTLEFLGE